MQVLRRRLPALLLSTVAMVAPLASAAPGLAHESPRLPARPPASSLGPGRSSVSAFGAAANLGPLQPLHANQPLVGMAAVPDGSGYWLVAADGGVFNYGASAFLGSMGGTNLNSPVVGVAATPDGGGYWLVAADGGIFNFGSAAFFGSMGGTRLNSPIVGIAAPPDGRGYWMVAADGGIFNFGSAAFFGSMGGTRLNWPVAGIAATPDGGGYWLAGGDGGVFNFGDAGLVGSLGGQSLSAPIVGIAPASNGSGYWLAGRDGRVYAQNVADLGSATTGVPGAPPVAGIVALASTGYWLLEGGSASRYTMSPGVGLAAVQQRLNDLGYWIGGATGSMNDATQQAIWAFQKYENLPRTATLDDAALTALANASRPRASVNSGDLIEVETGRDLVFIVQNGFTSWTFNTSTGGGYTYTSQGVTSVAITPVGIFHVAYGINGWHTSPLGQMWRPRFFVDGYALHGDDQVPPVAVSHGCVRVSIEAMNFIWDNNLAPVGEVVYVR